MICEHITRYLSYFVNQFLRLFYGYFVTVAQNPPSDLAETINFDVVINRFVIVPADFLGFVPAYLCDVARDHRVKMQMHVVNFAFWDHCPGVAEVGFELFCIACVEGSFLDSKLFDANKLVCAELLFGVRPCEDIPGAMHENQPERVDCDCDFAIFEEAVVSDATAILAADSSGDFFEPYVSARVVSKWCEVHADRINNVAYMLANGIGQNAFDFGSSFFTLGEHGRVCFVFQAPGENKHAQRFLDGEVYWRQEKMAFYAIPAAFLVVVVGHARHFKRIQIAKKRAFADIKLCCELSSGLSMVGLKEGNKAKQSVNSADIHGTTRF